MEGFNSRVKHAVVGVNVGGDDGKGQVAEEGGEFVGAGVEPEMC